MAIEITKLTPDNSIVMGIALCANRVIADAKNGVITDGVSTMEVPFEFFTGDVNAVRAQLHLIVDELVDAVLEPQDNKYYG